MIDRDDSLLDTTRESLRAGEARPPELVPLADNLERPAYYDIPGCNMNVPEVIRALGLSFDMGCVIKYAARAGKKPGVPPGQDVRKLIACARGRLDFIDAKGEERNP